MFIQVPKEYDDLDSEGQPPVGFWTGAAITEKHDIHFGTTAQIATMAYDGINPGKSLTSDEYEKSEYKRPGVTFPHGVSEARAKREAQRYDANLEYEETISGMNNTLLRWGSKGIGMIAAFTVDPVNLGAMAIGVRPAAALSVPLLTAAAKYGSLAVRGARFVPGGVEAAAATLPLTAVDYIAGTVYGEHPSALHAAAALGLNASLGGVLHSLFGGIGGRAIENSNHFEALKTSVNQLDAGNKVNVQEIIQDGAYQQDLINKGKMVDIFKNISAEEIEEQNVIRRTNVVNNLEDIKKDLKSVKGYNDVKTVLDKYINLLKNDIPDKELNLEQPEMPESLIKKPISTKKLINGDYRLNELLGKRTAGALKAKVAWENMVDNLAAVAVDGMDKEPLTMTQLKAASNRTKSYENINSVDPQEDVQFEQEVNNAKETTQTGAFEDDDPGLKTPTDEEITDLKNEIKAFSDELPDDIKDYYNNIDDIEESHNIIADALEKFAACIGEE